MVTQPKVVTQSANAQNTPKRGGGSKSKNTPKPTNGNVNSGSTDIKYTSVGNGVDAAVLLDDDAFRGNIIIDMPVLGGRFRTATRSHAHAIPAIYVQLLHYFPTSVPFVVQ